MGVIGTVRPDNPWNKNWNKQMNSNTHYWYNEKGQPRKSYTVKKTDVVSLDTAPSGEDFHTYGCWWVDANTVKFYFDGKYMFTLKPTTQLLINLSAGQCSSTWLLRLTTGNLSGLLPIFLRMRKKAPLTMIG